MEFNIPEWTNAAAIVRERMAEIDDLAVHVQAMEEHVDIVEMDLAWEAQERGDSWADEDAGSVERIASPAIERPVRQSDQGAGLG